MRITDRQRQLIENALDEASVTITSSPAPFKHAETLALIARANHGKGNWDMTDWRPLSAFSDAP